MENRTYIPKYFAGSFTGTGFTNFLPEAIGGMKKIYIIKGTPGSGKSTLMKKIASTAEDAGEKVERIYCSSDPSSLDGIIIPYLSFAMVDGTSPHVMEASCPIAVETIINTGDYISVEKVEALRDEIINLSSNKKTMFEKAEILLRSAAPLTTLKSQLLEETYDPSKGFRFCMNVVSSEKRIKKEGEISRRGVFAFGKNGISSVDAFSDAKKIYSLCGDYSPFVLGTLKMLCREHKLCAVWSPSPLNVNEASAIYFPNSQRLYVSSSWMKKGTIISSARFSKGKFEIQNKEKIRFLSKTLNLILDESRKYISDAMEYHRKLEEIYVSALNKEGLDCLYNSIALSIFGKE